MNHKRVAANYLAAKTAAHSYLVSVNHKNEPMVDGFLDPILFAMILAKVSGQRVQAKGNAIAVSGVQLPASKALELIMADFAEAFKPAGPRAWRVNVNVGSIYEKKAAQPTSVHVSRMSFADQYFEPWFMLVCKITAEGLGADGLPEESYEYTNTWGVGASFYNALDDNRKTDGFHAVLMQKGPQGVTFTLMGYVDNKETVLSTLGFTWAWIMGKGLSPGGLAKSLITKFRPVV
jgi:hypothetical protein